MRGISVRRHVAELKDRSAWCLQPGLPLLGEELLRLCKHAVFCAHHYFPGRKNFGVRSVSRSKPLLLTSGKAPVSLELRGVVSSCCDLRNSAGCKDSCGIDWTLSTFVGRGCQDETPVQARSNRCQLAWYRCKRFVFHPSSAPIGPYGEAPLTLSGLRGFRSQKGVDRCIYSQLLEISKLQGSLSLSNIRREKGTTTVVRHKLARLVPGIVWRIFSGQALGFRHGCRSTTLGKCPALPRTCHDP